MSALHSTTRVLPSQIDKIIPKEMDNTFFFSGTFESVFHLPSCPLSVFFVQESINPQGIWTPVSISSSVIDTIFSK